MNNCAAMTLSEIVATGRSDIDVGVSMPVQQKYNYSKKHKTQYVHCMQSQLIF